MLGTIMNALMLRGALTARTDTDVRVMTAVPIHSVAEPFIRLRAVHYLERGLIVLLAGDIGQPYMTTDYPAVQRALELDADALLVAKRGMDGVHDSDPHVNPDAVRYTTLTYDEVSPSRTAARGWSRPGPGWCRSVPCPGRRGWRGHRAR